MQQPFQPYPSLNNRTFHGLIAAQFIAAFNDQCIHAAAMFYAIHSEILSEAQAITLMPILFYAPWAIFCTLAGYLADRLSKRYTLIFWKVAEVAITAIALLGFYLGSVEKHPAGPWIVLSTVFLMGMHSAFYVPAKYGVMPEILPHNLLSKGNGILESTSFLAIILGTVVGGALSSPAAFKGREQYIGLFLFTLAIVGALASFLIQWMPPADPHRPFPWNPFKPVINNFRTMLRSRPLALAVLGIAFFTFMVAFMRATMYMHGETRNPRWDEFEISVVVGTVALGIGLGSPLAGWLSGNKVELGLVPLGNLGMMAATATAAFFLDNKTGLILCLIALGFSVGFYFVPLYSLMQHRAPKTSKGDLIATSNFINVVGAIVASVLFFFLQGAAHWAGLCPLVPPEAEFRGELKEVVWSKGHVVGFLLRGPEQDVKVGRFTPSELQDTMLNRRIVVDEDQTSIELLGRIVQSGTQPAHGTEVVVGRYVIRRGEHEVVHYYLRAANQPAKPVYNNEGLPRYLFLGASLMTLGVLLLLCRQLPDFFVRSLLWMRSTGRYHVKVHGINHLPTDDPAILATNCRSFEDSMHVLACTDRNVRFILLEEDHSGEHTPLLRYLARQTGMVVLPADKVTPGQIEDAIVAGTESLAKGDLVALSLDGEANLRRLLDGLLAAKPFDIVPVYCGTLAAHPDLDGKQPRRIRVVIGEPLSATATAEEVRHAIAHLGDWLHTRAAGHESHAVLEVPRRSEA